MRLHTWLLKLLQKHHAHVREPDVFIGGRTNTYLRRWFVIPHNKFLNIYLHQFLRSDDDRALHDHPWWNVSWLLEGNYYEVTAVKPKLSEVMNGDHYRSEWAHRLKPGGPRKNTHRRAGQFAFRLAKTSHRIQLITCCADRPEPHELPVWTLFITGPKIRVWGFHCREGWIAFDSAARKERRLNPGGPDGPCPN